MGSPTNASQGAKTTHTITIADNDVILGAFSISGITGASDATQDNLLNGGVNPIVTWGASANATDYDVTIYENDGTTVKCATQNTVSTDYDFSACNLTGGLNYKAKVVAKATGASSLDASNSLYTFKVNRSPTITSSGPWYVLSGGSITINTQWAASPTVGTAEDPDGDTLTFSALGSPNFGSVTNNSTNFSVSPGANTGAMTFTFSVSDGNGGSVSGTMTVHVVTAYTWSGGGGNTSWATAANWCGAVNTDKTGCAHTGAAPSSSSTATHLAIFDDTCQSNCSPTISAAATMYGLQMKSGYSGTITQNGANTVTVGAGRWSQAAGTFSGGSGDILISGTTTPLFQITGGTFTSTSGNFKIFASNSASTAFVQTGGTFNHNNGTLIFDGSYGGNITGTIDLNSTLSVYNLIYYSSSNNAGYRSNWTVASGDILEVANNFTMMRTTAAGNVYADGGTIRVYGNMTADRGAIGGTSNLEFYGTANQTYSANNSGCFPRLVVNKTGGSVAEATTDLCSATFTLTQGNFTAPSGTYTIYPRAGSSTVFTVSAGTYSHNNGTLKFMNNSNGTYTHTIDVDTTLNLYNLVYSNNGHNLSGTINIASGDTLNVTNFSILKSFAVASNKIIASGGTIQVSGAISSDESGRGGQTNVVLSGTGNQTYDVSNAGILPDVTINKASGTVTTSSTDVYLHSLTLTQGSFTAPAGILGIRSFVSPDVILSVASGTTFSHNNGTVSFATTYNGHGTYTIDVPTSLTLNNLSIGNNSHNYTSSVIISSGDTLYVNDLSFDPIQGILTSNYTYLNTGTIAVSGDVLANERVSGGSASIVLAGTGNQTYGSIGGYLPRLFVDKASGSVTSSTPDGYLTALHVQQGSFTAPSGNLIVRLDPYYSSGSTAFSILPGASFNHNSGTLEFTEYHNSTGFNWVIDLDSTLTVNNLKINPQYPTHTKYWTLAAGDKMIVGGNLTVERSSGSAFFVLNGGTLEVQGNATFGIGAQAGTTALTFSGTGHQVLTHSGGNLPKGQWTLDKAGGTFTQATAVTFGGAGHNLNVVNGNWDMNNFNLSNIATLNIQVGGTVTKGTGTLGYTTCGGPGACP